MKAAATMSPDNKALENVGRATLQIVHDLKNQLNGLKLYATFLRKRLEQHENLLEERETVAKLIAGLDRAAGDMTVLVRYAQPLELRRQPRADLRRIVEAAVRETRSRGAAYSLNSLNVEIEPASFHGELDSVALSEALRTMTEQALSRNHSREAKPLFLRVTRTGTRNSPCALIEWRGAKLDNGSRLSFDRSRSVHDGLAARVIEAHGGLIEFETDTIRVRLPLSN